jgi:hypothetical protein
MTPKPIRREVAEAIGVRLPNADANERAFDRAAGVNADRVRGNSRKSRSVLVAPFAKPTKCVGRTKRARVALPLRDDALELEFGDRFEERHAAVDSRRELHARAVESSASSSARRQPDASPRNPTSPGRQPTRAPKRRTLRPR